MPMRISYSYHNGADEIFKTESETVLIGRRQEGIAVDLDLAPDMMVSSPHAKVWRADDQYWIEDLDSAWGTKLNGEQIKGRGKQPLQSGDIIKIGEWTLILHNSAEYFDSYASHPALETTESFAAMTPLLDANLPAFTPEATGTAETAQRMALFYELPLKFALETRLGALFKLIVEQAVEAIPRAVRGALLIKNPATGKLSLKAHLPMGHTAVSHAIAQQALERRLAFVWPAAHQAVNVRGGRRRAARSNLENRTESAMYAPLLWKDEAFGVLSVDNCETCGHFQVGDLQLLQAIAQHAAMAIANLEAHESWRHQSEAYHNFLKLVSPQIAERLQQQHRGIHLGGEFCEATILLSDIRGFTNLSATMAPSEVTEMLDDYFGRLVPVIFKSQGTVDKYVGDAILAVFGSPEPDERQHIHAVRAAVGMQAAMYEVNARRAAAGKRTSELGIGVHCGEVVHGLIGTTKRMEFTVIGDTVNRASRYCDGARAGEVLISPEIYHHVADQIEAEQTSIATKHEGYLDAYRVLSLKGSKK